MNEDIDNNKDYQIMELKQRISYYESYKQKYEDLKEDWKYIKSLLDKEFNERTRLKKENEQLHHELQQIKEELKWKQDCASRWQKERERLTKENKQAKRYIGGMEFEIVKLDKGNKALHKFITDNEELKTHNLQHFLEWLVIKGYVTDEPMKDINNVIDCVNKFKEYLPVLNKITEINNEIGFDSDE